MNILTFDIEEWFHLLDYDATRNEADWEQYEVRIFENVERILNLLEETNSTATFFIIGWVAKKYPELVRKIAERYEIGSHTMTHQLVWQQSRQEFQADVEASVKMLEDITGRKVTAFRAPGFSIHETEAWAFDILAELGIETDCSIFPASHAHGGMPSYGAPVPSLVKHGDVMMKEFPISTKTMLGRKLIFSGGGYFRLFPYPLIKRWSKQCEHDYVNHRVSLLDGKDDGYLMSYIHPRDLDAGQPMLEGLPLKRKFKSYVGLQGAEQKLRKYLTDFKFVDVRTASKMIDWSRTPMIEL